MSLDCCSMYRGGYDPYLNRFTQPDFIVPDQYNVLDWDRYQFVRSNPVRYTDSSGHCIDGISTWACLALIIGGAVLGTSFYNNVIREPSEPANANASDFGDLLWLGYEHADHANITGEGLQSLQDDPSVEGAQKDILNIIKGKPEYGEQAYDLKDISGYLFTANGPSRDKYQAAQEGNQAFWMVHSATVSATNIQVSADGTISLTWVVTDIFDYRPEMDRGLSDYNFFAVLVYPFYYGLLGAEDVPTIAEWDETIPSE